MNMTTTPPRLKHLLSAIYAGGTPESGNEDYWTDDEAGVAWVAIGDMSSREQVYETQKRITKAGLESKRLEILQPGTLIYSMYASVGHVAELAIPATINQALLGFEFKPGVSKHYIKWYLRHLQKQVLEEVSSNTQDNLNAEKVRNFSIHLPPQSEQERIACFLDNEAARIDSLIAEKQRLTDLLAEKRRTVIADFLTKGLNKDTPRSDSDIPWLGEIPSHWKIERAKWLFTERDDRSDSGGEELLTVSHLTGVTSRAEKDVNMFMAESLEGYKRCEAGDLVINTLWAWMGAMGIARQPGIVSPAYNVYKPVAELDPEYVDLLVRTPRFVEEITRYSKGVWSSRLRLYPEGLYEAWLPVPPLDEQQATVKHVQLEIRKLDALAGATERTIALLQERRSALISAAVTGQLEIGEAAA
jgi:type I restriction enzyme S subunit